MASLDDQVEMAMDILPSDTRTAIDEHPRSHLIKEALVVYALSRHSERPHLAEYVRTINADLGCDLTETQVSYYLERYVAPAVFITPAFVKQSLIAAGHDLNTARLRHEILDRAKTKYLEACAEEDSSPTRVMNLSQQLMALIEKVDDSLERFNVIPKRREERINLNANLDVNEAMKALD